MLQHLPAGRSFAEALLTEPAERLLAGLDALQSALRELGFSHNNLRPDNLRWSGGRFIPLRYHDARFGTSDGDAEAFEALRRQVREAAARCRSPDIEADYAPLRRLTGHRWTSHVFEGLVCVEDDEGFGFVDTDNNPVIASHFVWAGDFREGRAEVETPGGMGAHRPERKLRHPARIRNRGLHPGRKHRPGAPERPLGGIRLPGTATDGIRYES